MTEQSFDFLGYAFQPRRAKNWRGKYFVSFLPAISPRSEKARPSANPRLAHAPETGQVH